MKIIDAIAHFFSIVFIPLLIPTYAIIIALWGTYLDFVELSTRLTVLAVTFGFTAMLPAIIIFLMNKLGLISDPGLNNRTDRFIPIGISILCYIGIAMYFSKIHSPGWLILFMMATAMAALTMLVVSRWWKISGHATGMGGLVAFTFIICFRNYTIHNNLWLFIASLAVAGIVCTARLILRRHTLAQVTAGFANGLFWIALVELIF